MSADGTDFKLLTTVTILFIYFLITHFDALLANI